LSAHFLLAYMPSNPSPNSHGIELPEINPNSKKPMPQHTRAQQIAAQRADGSASEERAIQPVLINNGRYSKIWEKTWKEFMRQKGWGRGGQTVVPEVVVCGGTICPSEAAETGASGKKRWSRFFLVIGNEAGDEAWPPEKGTLGWEFQTMLTEGETAARQGGVSTDSERSFEEIFSSDPSNTMALEERMEKHSQRSKTSLCDLLEKDASNFVRRAVCAR
jgi:hypothetical protein